MRLLPFEAPDLEAIPVVLPDQRFDVGREQIPHLTRNDVDFVIDQRVV